MRSPPHPCTPPSKNHMMNPDMALARLARAVPQFTDQVTTFLSSPGAPHLPGPAGRGGAPHLPGLLRGPKWVGGEGVMAEIRVRTYGDASVATGEDRTVLGGCATVAGWGHRCGAGRPRIQGRVQLQQREGGLLHRPLGHLPREEQVGRGRSTIPAAAWTTGG